jgi:hypothetical protein
VRGRDKNIFIEMHDKAIYSAKLHPLNDKIFINEEDLKLLYFYSNNEYQIPKISTIEKIEPNDPVIVSGYPCVSTCDINLRNFKTYQGSIESIKTLVSGYNLSYAGISAEKGSSGGAIIWKNTLIGINGKGTGTHLPFNDQYKYADGSKGMSTEELDKLKRSSLGISLDTFKKELENNRQLFDLPRIGKVIQYVTLPISQGVIRESSEENLNKPKENNNYLANIAKVIIAILFVIIFYILFRVNDRIHKINIRIEETHNQTTDLIKEESKNNLSVISSCLQDINLQLKNSICIDLQNILNDISITDESLNDNETKLLIIAIWSQTLDSFNKITLLQNKLQQIQVERDTLLIDVYQPRLEAMAEDIKNQQTDNTSKILNQLQQLQDNHIREQKCELIGLTNRMFEIEYLLNTIIRSISKTNNNF